MIFWLSILISLICILRTTPTPTGNRSSDRSVGEKYNEINRWDIIFFLSSWQMFNLGIWHKYLGDSGISYSYNVASVICSLLMIFYLIRRGIKLNFRISMRAAKEWLMWTGILLTILLPIGFSIGFLKMSPFGRSLVGGESEFLRKTLLDYFIFVAVIEELVFRGFVFNLLKRTYDEKFSLMAVTILFAIIPSHIASGHFPNWPYVGMAFLAGGAYGISYWRTNNILVPILIHGTVDSVWRILFS